MRDMAKNLRALGNERRLKIVALLARGGARSVGELAEAIRLSFRSTSRHLQILKSVDILTSQQVKLTVLYRLNHEHPVLRVLLSYLKK